MQVEIKILNKEFYKTVPMLNNHSYTPDLPRYATSGSAAMDLVCTEDVTLYPGETKAIHTGLAIWIGSDLHTQSAQRKQDMGVAGLMLPRSGLGTQGLVLANTIGLIDEDYQGELIVQAWNRNESASGPFGMVNLSKIQLKAGDRFAQLCFIPIIKASWNIVEEFSNETKRGTGGFGSTSK